MLKKDKKMMKKENMIKNTKYDIENYKIIIKKILFHEFYLLK
jgi:hypothetical protein